MQFHLIVIWFHLKLCTKKEGDCFGRLRERRIWLAYDWLLSSPFLYVTRSTPTNSLLFKNRLKFGSVLHCRKRPAISVAIDTFNLKVCVGADEGNDISDHSWALLSFFHKEKERNRWEEIWNFGGIKHLTYHLKPRSAIVT